MVPFWLVLSAVLTDPPIFVSTGCLKSTHRGHSLAPFESTLQLYFAGRDDNGFSNAHDDANYTSVKSLAEPTFVSRTLFFHSTTIMVREVVRCIGLDIRGLNLRFLS